MAEIRRIPVGGGELLIHSPNALCKWRAKTFHTKEPGTVAWIGQMKPGETLFDVGANIGIYSLYAGLRGIKVHAFEPHPANYEWLVRNVELNGLGGLITAHQLAVSDKSGIETLYIAKPEPGTSHNNFGASLDCNGRPKTFPLEIKIGGISLDYLPWDADHIKIDVDGIEDKVISGAAKQLAGAKSVLVEINEKIPAHREIAAYMASLGFKAEMCPRKNPSLGNVIFSRA